MRDLTLLASQHPDSALLLGILGICGLTIVGSIAFLALGDLAEMGVRGFLAYRSNAQK